MSLKEQRESSCGHHYISCYQSCPRKWFIRYILGLLPEKTPSYFVLGKALHETAAFYLNEGPGSFAKVEAFMIPTFEALTEDLEGDPQELYTTLARMVRSALPTWDSILRDYTIVALEDEFFATLANGFKMTMRPDALVASKTTGDLWVLEHKNTQSSDSTMFRNVANSDQITAYTLGLRKVSLERYGIEPERVLGGLPIVSYVKGSVERTSIGDPIMPTRWQLDEYEARSIGLLSELGNKTSLLKRGTPVEVLFGRSPSTCSGVLKCEYESFCKRYLTYEDVPEGFRKDSSLLYEGPLTDPERFIAWLKGDL